jgi:hypothetical protein
MRQAEFSRSWGIATQALATQEKSMFNMTAYLRRIKAKWGWKIRNTPADTSGRRPRLEIEILEDRAVPAGVVVNYAVSSDWGSGFQA